MRPSSPPLKDPTPSEAPNRLGITASVACVASVTILLGYILFRPVSHNAILYGAFLLLGSIAAVSLWRRQSRVTWELLALALITAGLGTYGTLIGVGNPGLLFTVLIWFAAPALYFLLSAAATPDAVFWFVRVAAVATLAIATMILVFVAGEAGLIPQLVPAWLQDQTGLGATFRVGSSQARFYGLSSLAALGPLWAASLVVGRDRLLPSWWLRLVCAAAAAAAAFVSSRDAIVLVIVAAPALALVVRILIRPRPFTARRFTAAHASIWSGALVAACVAAIGLAPRVAAFPPLVNAWAAVSSFFTGKAPTSEADQSIRSDQAAQLLEAWARNPVFGSGFGARVPGYARTSERPWVLELQYHLFLFNVGLVGLLFVTAIAVGAFVLVRRSARRAPDLLPSLTAFSVAGLAMVISNATNPYLQAPGHMWALFLPLALANVILEPSAPATPLVSAHNPATDAAIRGMPHRGPV